MRFSEAPITVGIATAAMDALFTAGSSLHKLFAGMESVFEGSPFMGNAANSRRLHVRCCLLQCQ